MSPLDEKFDWNALKESPALDDPKEMIKDQKEKPEYRTENQKNTSRMENFNTKEYLRTENKKEFGLNGIQQEL